MFGVPSKISSTICHALCVLVTILPYIILFPLCTKCWVHLETSNIITQSIIILVWYITLVTVFNRLWALVFKLLTSADCYNCLLLNWRLISLLTCCLLIDIKPLKLWLNNWNLDINMSTSDSLPKFKPLSNWNYPEWCGEMRAWLMKNGLWRFVSGKETKQKDKQAKAERAAGEIYLLVENDQRVHFCGFEEDPIKMWELLEKAHLSKKPGARFTAYDDLFSIYKESNEALMDLGVLLRFHNHVNLITVSNHHHHHNSDPRRYSCLLSSPSPSNYSDISLSQSLSYSEVMITLSSSSLVYWMSTLFGNHRWISPWSLYSTFGPSTCVSGYGHARNDLLLLSHVYSMSQILLVVYSSHTSLYYPSFKSWLSSSNLFSELSLRLVFAIHNLPISFSEI